MNFQWTVWVANPVSMQTFLVKIVQRLESLYEYLIDTRYNIHSMDLAAYN